nr:MAG TPA: hypothetical protein [Caudoviricetes sp.]
MKYIIAITVIGLLLTIIREWDSWVHDVCDCMVSHVEKEDETE